MSRNFFYIYKLYLCYKKYIYKITILFLFCMKIFVDISSCSIIYKSGHLIYSIYIYIYIYNKQLIHYIKTIVVCSIHFSNWFDGLIIIFNVRTLTHCCAVQTKLKEKLRNKNNKQQSHENGLKVQENINNSYIRLMKPQRTLCTLYTYTYIYM